MAVLGGWAVPYERGTPVTLNPKPTTLDPVCPVCRPAGVADTFTPITATKKVAENNRRRIRSGKLHRTLHPTLEATQGKISSQSPTDATRFWWHLYGS